jgi:PAS domain S-box-containing protein
MDDKHKTRAQLIGELEELRRRVAQMPSWREPRPNLHPSLLPWAEGTSSAVFIWQDAEFRYTNPAMSRLTGYSPQELIGRNIWSLIHPDSRELIEDRVAAWQRGESVPERSEFKILTKGGKTRWINADSTFIGFDRGQAVLTIAFDSTAHQTAKQALNASEERYRNIVETAQEGIWIVDAEAKTIYVNHHLAEMFLCARHEMLGVSVFEFVDDASHQEARRLLEQGRRGIKGHHDFRFLRKDGSDLWVIASTTPLFDAEGRFAGGLAMLVDITEHHEAEAAMRLSEERFRTLVNSMDDIVFTIGRDQRYSGVFGQKLKGLGVGCEAFIGRTATEVFGEAAGRVHDDASRRAMSGEQVVYDWSSTHALGTFFFQTRLSPIRDRNDEVTGLVGVARDITDRRLAENAIRFQANLLDEVDQAVIATNLSGCIIYWNRFAEELYGWPATEAVGRNIVDTTPAEASRVQASEIMGHLKEGRSWSGEFLVRRKDRTTITVMVTDSPICDENGTMIGIVGVSTNITERKRAEQALLESRSRLQAILDHCPAMIFQKDLDGRYLQINRQFEHTFNVTAEQVLGRTDAEVFPADLATQFRATDRQVLEGGGSLEFEESTASADGLRAYIVHKFPLQDTEGRIYSVGGISTDITARKRAEDDLRTQKEILQKIFDHVPVMIRLGDAEGRVKLVNREWERTFGWSLEEIKDGGFDIFTELYPDPEYREYVLNLIASSTGEFTELKTRTRDGRVIDIVFASVLLEDGTSVGIERDITERIKAEQAQQLSAKRYRDLVELTHDLVWAVDEEGRITYMSPASRRFYGRDPEEMVGRLYTDFLPPDEGRRSMAELKNALAHGANFSESEVRALHKDGSEVVLLANAVVLRDAAGNNVGTAGTSQNITERRQAEESRRRQAAQLAALHEIELEISAESDLSRILEIVTRRAAELLDAAFSSTYIRNRDKGAATIVASLQGRFVGLQVDEGEGLEGQALQTGHVLAVDDYSQWLGRARVFDPDGFGPTIAAPLKWQQTVIGILSLSRREGEEPFSVEDSRLLEQFAAVAAIAIHQATLFDEVQESQRRLQTLSHRLIETQEAERKRLSRELHDQIGQALTAVQISLQILASTCDEISVSFPDVCLGIIEDAIQQVHDLSLDLRPSLLDDLGLVAALRWYVDRTANLGSLAARFEADELDRRLPPEVETACFRIAQEALTNVLRHAEAVNIRVQVTQSDYGLRLVVQDDGLGFDVRFAMNQTGVNASLGLQGMQERAAALGGIVDIKSQPGSGVEVLATFPL